MPMRLTQAQAKDIKVYTYNGVVLMSYTRDETDIEWSFLPGTSLFTILQEITEINK